MLSGVIDEEVLNILEYKAMKARRVLHRRNI
jgi:hypothetical protein